MRSLINKQLIIIVALAAIGASILVVGFASANESDPPQPSPAPKAAPEIPGHETVAVEGPWREVERDAYPTGRSVAQCPDGFVLFGGEQNYGPYPGNPLKSGFTALSTIPPFFTYERAVFEGITEAWAEGIGKKGAQIQVVAYCVK